MTDGEDAPRLTTLRLLRGDAATRKLCRARFGEDRLYFVEITGKREPIEFLRGTSFSFHLVSN
jgi:hypothetical protein